ncbi:hypothetical protein POM88_038396 [Heracleum sosnowskyi]|uniref:BED-type domain-containing protein n=1 Tax=Heracleum sosnowskyi TaxID=360622 RepID=A0AAD8M5F2_9APIA|nr:hypothetical protein POM88_038395 [Heracleum sosnowskyi]KAK1362835.1 hypothetical protein POM88_038396 [Heracleum sosnowskyi]
MDFAWEHGKKIVKGKRAYAVCNYCSHTVQGVARLKYHLANVKGIIKVCKKVPQPVKEGFRENFCEHPSNPKLLILKDKQNRVPVPDQEDRHGDDANSSPERPRPSKSVKTGFQRLEERMEKTKADLDELREQLQKLRDAE